MGKNTTYPHAIKEKAYETSYKARPAANILVYYTERKQWDGD